MNKMGVSFWGPSRQAAFSHEQTGPRVVAAVCADSGDPRGSRDQFSSGRKSIVHASEPYLSALTRSRR